MVHETFSRGQGLKKSREIASFSGCHTGFRPDKRRTGTKPERLGQTRSNLIPLAADETGLDEQQRDSIGERVAEEFYTSPRLPHLHAGYP